MTTLTWIGGGNNRANNPNDWSPHSSPQPGDTLIMQDGTMNIHGNDLAGDTLSLSLGGPDPNLGPITLNLSNHAVLTEDLDPYGTGAQVTFNLSNSTLNLNAGSGLGFGAIIPVINLRGVDTVHYDAQSGNGGIINLAPGSRWIGDVTVPALGNHDFGGNITVNGAPCASFQNESSEIDNAHTTINANVVGTGTFGLGLHPTFLANPATLEFAGSVGRGQTVMMSEAGDHNDGSLVLQLDKPWDFHGSVTYFQGTIDLVGLANADSYSFKNDILAIFSGNKVIDRLRLQDTSPYGFAVEQTATGVSVVGITNPASPPMGLPVHVG